MNTIDFIIIFYWCISSLIFAAYMFDEELGISNITSILYAFIGGVFWTPIIIGRTCKHIIED